MKIALIGYGKMGREIEKVLLSRQHEVFAKGNSQVPLFSKNLEGADVAIEFSRPDSAVRNLFECFEAGTPVVCGTTGWYNRLPEVRNVCKEYDGTLFYASNFSLGVHIFQFVTNLMTSSTNFDTIWTVFMVFWIFIFASHGFCSSSSSNRNTPTSI